MIVNKIISDFSVFGGPLKRFGIRTGLIRDNNSILMGIVLGFLTWIILLVLSVVAGSVKNFFSLSVIAGHVRFLIAIPLFFVCETLVAPQMSEFAVYIVKSGLVPENEVPALTSVIQKIKRVKDSRMVETILFLVVLILPVFDNTSILKGNSASASYVIEHGAGHVTFTSLFYIWIALPMFRFLLLRWFWHLGLWWYFLYQVQKLKLSLISTHSDGVAGLGYLEVTQQYFSTLALAFSAILSASIAEQIMTGETAFESLYYLIPIVLVFMLILFVAPLSMFSGKLKKCRESGLKDYMTMSANYVRAFEKKWINDKMETGESQLGTADLQSLADLTNSVKVIQGMQLVPVTRKLIIFFVVSVVLPFVPFVFMKFNLGELMALLFKLLAGK